MTVIERINHTHRKCFVCNKKIHKGDTYYKRVISYGYGNFVTDSICKTCYDKGDTHTKVTNIMQQKLLQHILNQLKNDYWTDLDVIWKHIKIVYSDAVLRKILEDVLKISLDDNVNWTLKRTKHAIDIELASVIKFHIVPPPRGRGKA